MQTPREAGRGGGGAEGQRALRGGAGRTGAPGAWEAARAGEKVLGRSVWGWLAWGGPWDFLTPLRNLGGLGLAPSSPPPPPRPAAALPGSRPAPGAAGAGAGALRPKAGWPRQAPATAPTLRPTPRASPGTYRPPGPTPWSPGGSSPHGPRTRRARGSESASPACSAPAGPAGSAPRELPPRTGADGRRELGPADGERGRVGAGGVGVRPSGRDRRSGASCLSRARPSRAPVLSARPPRSPQRSEACVSQGPSDSPVN